MTPTISTKLPHASQSLSQANWWVQRALLGLLVVGHMVLPFLFAFGHGALVRDSVLLSQGCLFFIALVFCGWGWRGTLGLLLGALAPAVGWWLFYPSYLWEYAVSAVVLPGAALAFALLVLRIAGFRGTWRAPDTRDLPWQISIGQLLVVTALAAVSLAATNWVREWTGHISMAGLPELWFLICLDGLSTAGLALFALWSLGTRGELAGRLLVLLLGTLFVTGCQIYAFRMEGYWSLAVTQAVCWFAVTSGSLLIIRLCGWQMKWIGWPKLIVRESWRGA